MKNITALLLSILILVFTSTGFASEAAISTANQFEVKNSSWSYLGLANSHITSLSFLDDALLAVGENDRGEILLSRWVGSEWKDMSTGLEKNEWADAFISVGDDSYVGTNGGVYKWTGTRWQNIGLKGIEVASLASVKGILYAGTENGVYCFTSTGWQKAGSMVDGITSLSVVNGNDLYASGHTKDRMHGVVYKWVGSDWQLLPSPGSITWVNSSVSIGSDLYVCGNGLIFKWSGSSWQTISLPDESYSMNIFASGGYLYMNSHFSPDNEDLLKWTGSAWQALGPKEGRGFTAFTGIDGLLLCIADSSRGVFCRASPFNGVR